MQVSLDEAIKHFATAAVKILMLFSLLEQKRLYIFCVFPCRIFFLAKFYRLQNLIKGALRVVECMRYMSPFVSALRMHFYNNNSFYELQINYDHTFLY